MYYNFFTSHLRDFSIFIRITFCLYRLLLIFVHFGNVNKVSYYRLFNAHLPLLL